MHRALKLGWEDFKAVPSHAIILCVIYPVLGLLLARAAFGYAVIPLLFPLAAGFALLGPFAALGLYELSSRRERGQQASAWDALDVLRSPSFGGMLGLGALLLALFVTWVATAQAIYIAVFGYGGGQENRAFASAHLEHPPAAEPATRRSEAGRRGGAERWARSRTAVPGEPRRAGAASAPDRGRRPLGAGGRGDRGPGRRGTSAAATAARGQARRSRSTRPGRPAVRRAGDRVKVELGRRKGKITVEFASLDDLDRIVKAMSREPEPGPVVSRAAPE